MEEDEDEEEAIPDPLLSFPSSNTSSSSSSSLIPTEIVSEEEMALIEAALSAAAAVAARSSSSLSRPSSSMASSIFSSFSSPQRDVRNLKRFASSLRSRRMLSACSNEKRCRDIEDLDSFKKKMRLSQSLFQRFRIKRGLSVTDITATEWCEKQMEFTLLHGKPRRTDAMKAGSARHLELEEEVMKKVEIRIQSVEESWAIKLINIIVGAKQLLSEGFARELPVIGLVEGVWIIGVIDEVRMPTKQTAQKPSLIDTKTRSRAKIASEAQKRNARLQLMCYKYLLDNMVTDNFPSSDFFNFFGLNPEYTLSHDIRLYIINSGFHAETLRELVTHFSSQCRMLPAAHEQLVLRYEYQGDWSLLEEYQFTYDEDWLKTQVLQCLKFWKGEKEAAYVSTDEGWKCQFCSFTAKCPMAKTPAGTQPENGKQ